MKRILSLVLVLCLVAGLFPQLLAHAAVSEEATVLTEEISIRYPSRPIFRLPEEYWPSNDVYVLQPFYKIDKIFKDDIYKVGLTIAEALGGTCYRYTGADVTIERIADAMENGRFVLIDTHGDIDLYSYGVGPNRGNTSYICIQPTAENLNQLTEEDWAAAEGPYGEYCHTLLPIGGKYLMIDGTVIANHMDNFAPNSFVWLGCCEGMSSAGLAEPLRNAGVGVVCGFPGETPIDASYSTVEHFIDQLIDGQTISDILTYDRGMYELNGGSSDPNFIVVSSEDPYPTTLAPNTYQEVKSTWNISGCAHKNTELVNTTWCFSEKTGYGAMEYRCLDCDRTVRRGVKDQKGHNFVYTGEEPSCFGNTLVRYTCADCGYKNEAFIKRLPHDYVWENNVPPCQLKPGNETSGHCARCNTGTMIYFEPIPCKEVIDEAVAPTCTEPGLTEGSHCAYCKKVIVAQKTVPALGHKYAYRSNEDGTHCRACKQCGQKKAITGKRYDVACSYLDGKCTVCKESAPIVCIGTCADRMSWTLDTAGILTISGYGDMDDFKAGISPWLLVKDKIMYLKIADTVTSIGSNAFYNCNSLIVAHIPESVDKIGCDAFAECDNLQGVIVMNALCDIADSPYTLGNSKENWIHSSQLSYASSYANKYGYSFEPCCPSVEHPCAICNGIYPLNPQTLQNPLLPLEPIRP